MGLRFDLYAQLLWVAIVITKVFAELQLHVRAVDCNKAVSKCADCGERLNGRVNTKEM